MYNIKKALVITLLKHEIFKSKLIIYPLFNKGQIDFLKIKVLILKRRKERKDCKMVPNFILNKNFCSAPISCKKIFLYNCF